MNPLTKAEPCLPRILALALLTVVFLLLFTGCVSSRYKEAKKGTPPPQALNVAFAPAPLEATLATLVTYNGPGSWKRDAFWDEYVVTLHNPGREPLTVSGAGLVDVTGQSLSAGSEPWTLEKQSKTLEQKYKDAGVAFVRYTAPSAIIVGAGAAVIGSTSGGFLVASSAASTAAAATVVALPLYYAVVLTINHYNKVAMEKEFTRRRLALQFTLAPSETRTGSLFFPMVPNPRALGLRWSTGATSGETALPLDFLHGLHAAPADAAKR